MSQALQNSPRQKTKPIRFPATNSKTRVHWFPSQVCYKIMPRSKTTLLPVPHLTTRINGIIQNTSGMNLKYNST